MFYQYHRLCMPPAGLLSGAYRILSVTRGHVSSIWAKALIWIFSFIALIMAIELSLLIPEGSHFWWLYPRVLLLHCGMSSTAKAAWCFFYEISLNLMIFWTYSIAYWFPLVHYLEEIQHLTEWSSNFHYLHLDSAFCSDYRPKIAIHVLSREVCRCFQHRSLFIRVAILLCPDYP